MARDVAPRGYGDSNRGEQDRDERRQIEESAGAIDSRTDLRTRFVDVDQALSGFFACSQFLLECRTAWRSPANRAA